MNWKRLFFISTFFWISVFVLTNCSPQQMKFSQKLIEGTDIADCDKNPEKCKAIDRQIEAYKNLLMITDTEISLLDEPIGVDSLNQKSITVNGKNIGYNTIENEEETLRGYRFSAKEVSTLAAYALSKKGDGYIYTMFAINPKAKGRSNSNIKYMDLYFQVKNKKGDLAYYDHGGADDKLPLNFGDFPKPCPNSCPDDD